MRDDSAWSEARRSEMDPCQSVAEGSALASWLARGLDETLDALVGIDGGTIVSPPP